MKSYDVVTFDCYGTLIDWNKGIGDAFVAGGVVAEDERDAALAAYHEAEAKVERGRYMSYREILAETFQRAGAKLGRPLPADRYFLAGNLPWWKPFPDTNEALERLVAAGYELGILSNVDDELLAATRKHFTVEFSVVVTAEQVHSYKPAHGHFLEAKRRIGNRTWLHAAESHYHDVTPCAALGIPSAWVNRQHAEPSSRAIPDMEVADLRELADLLCE